MGGLRPQAASNHLLLSLSVPVPLLDRGQAQVRLRAQLNQTHLSCQLQDMMTNQTRAAVADRIAEADPTPLVHLPSLWKYQNIYSALPHQGFALLGPNRFLSLHQTPDQQTGVDFPREAGEVAPYYTASKCWPAAFVLLRFLEKEPQNVPRSTVLELGTGTGAVGLGVSLLSPGHDVTLTDLQVNLKLAETNRESNNAAASVLALDWTKPLPAGVTSVDWKYVIFADCVFWVQLFEPLIQTVKQLAGPTTTVFFSITHRFNRTSTFLAKMKQE